MTDSLLRLDLTRTDGASDSELCRSVSAALRSAQRNPEVRAVALTGFALATGRDPAGASAEELASAIGLLRSVAVPTIAALDGDASGIGAGLLLGCDLRIATPPSRLVLVPADAASPLEVGPTWALVHTLGRARAFDLLSTGRPVAAAECLELGIVSRVVTDPDRALAELVAELEQRPPASLAAVKRSVLRAEEVDAEEALTFEALLAETVR